MRMNALVPGDLIIFPLDQVYVCRCPLINRCMGSTKCLSSTGTPEEATRVSGEIMSKSVSTILSSVKIESDTDALKGEQWVDVILLAVDGQIWSTSISNHTKYDIIKLSSSKNHLLR